ncbi:hypothetical protein [Arthrobacter sp. HLT1-21]
MTIQPSDTTRTNDLADFEIPCDFGEFPRALKGQAKCTAPAEWSFKVHSTSLSGVCPEVVLVCEEHLRSIRAASRGQLEKVLALGVCSHHLLRCAICHLPILGPDDLLWGIERIR